MLDDRGRGPPLFEVLTDTGGADRRRARSADWLRGRERSDCAAKRCGIVRNGVIVFTPDNHLSVGFTPSVTPLLGARLDQALGLLIATR